MEKINWRQIFFSFVGLFLLLSERWHWDRISIGVVILVMYYLVIEVGIKISQGYGLGRSGNETYTLPKKAGNMSRLNLILTEAGLLIITSLLSIFWFKK